MTKHELRRFALLSFIVMTTAVVVLVFGQIYDATNSPSISDSYLISITVVLTFFAAVAPVVLMRLAKGWTSFPAWQIVLPCLYPSFCLLVVGTLNLLGIELWYGEVGGVIIPAFFLTVWLMRRRVHSQRNPRGKTKIRQGES